MGRYVESYTRTTCAASGRSSGRSSCTSPTAPIAGRADVILDQEGGATGALAIVDYKAAQDAMRDDRYRQQLAVYAAAGRGEGLEVAAAYLHELGDSSVRHQVDIAARSHREPR